MGEELVLRESWGGAAERGLQARTERENIIGSVLKKDHDFGIIPGTDKPTLLKAGAEKIADSLNCYADYEAITTVEDWDKPLFYYRYRCVLRARGSDNAVVTGIGSCSSMEGRYRWRPGKRLCPTCGKETIIKGKEEYGGGWLCFAKKGGCGAKFIDKDPRIIGQSTERVANDDVYSLVNTIDKMAQKRSLVAAILNLGFSEQFTQDIEDMPQAVATNGDDVIEAAVVESVFKGPMPSPSPGTVVFTVQPPAGGGDDLILEGGKHKGESIRVVDNGYLTWLIGAVEKDINDTGKSRYKPANEDKLRRLLYEKQRRAVMAAEVEADEKLLNDPNKLFEDAESDR